MSAPWQKRCPRFCQSFQGMDLVVALLSYPALAAVALGTHCSSGLRLPSRNTWRMHVVAPVGHIQPGPVLGCTGLT